MSAAPLKRTMAQAVTIISLMRAQLELDLRTQMSAAPLKLNRAVVSPVGNGPCADISALKMSAAPLKPIAERGAIFVVMRLQISALK